MATKEYKYDVKVTRAWGGVEDVVITGGTDNQDELKDMVNDMALAMEDRAHNHLEKLKKAEEIQRQVMERARKRDEAEEAEAPKE